MPKKQTNQTSVKRLLDKQTSVILSAVDKKLVVTKLDTISEVDKKLTITKIDILSAVDKKLAKMEIRINQKIDKLTSAIDKFLNRLTKIEDEFTVMKFDISRLKKVVREKLGVDL